MNTWKARHYMSNHGGQLTANSKSLVQRQRRTDDQVSWVGKCGTRSWWWLAERNRCLLTMSEAGVTQSIRYCGALCCWHRRTVTPSLYCTRSGTSSQCKSTCSRRDRPRSNLWVPLTRRAAAFSTRWMAPSWFVMPLSKISWTIAYIDIIVIVSYWFTYRVFNITTSHWCKSNVCNFLIM